MKYLSFIFLIISFCFTPIVRSQEKPLSVFLMVGSAQASTGGFGAHVSGGSLGSWNNGLQFTAGAEYPLSKRFTARGMINFSKHSYDNFSTREFFNNNPVLTMFDIWGNLKLNIWVFYLHLGAGFSFQHGEAVLIWNDKGHFPMYESPARKDFLLTGLLGLGLDVRIYEQFSLIAEVDILMRQYAGMGASVGIKYKL